MASLKARNNAFVQDTHDQLRGLCRQPCNVDPKSGVRGVISDEKFESIAACLRDLEMDEASDRPRTYAVLHMMNRIDLITAFVVNGLLDNSFPYADRKSLPPLMRREHDACHDFLDLQYHVMSAACHMEKGLDSIHVHAESGDVFFQRIEKLGRGGEATVDRVRSRMTKQEYARKRIHRQKDLKKDKQILERFENELQILKKLDHTHLVKVFASYTDLKFVAILMKPVAEMDLKQYLKNWGGKSLTGSERERFRTYYGCLTSAICYLHENNIRHKDIKPNNILLKRDDIYITDFGTAIEFDNDQSMTKGTAKVKTNQYQSPEVSRGTIRGKASDIWSLGVTFLEMTTVLRGESLEGMQAFFLENGTREAYVYGNIPGAILWMEFLRKAPKLPRVDNSTMQWMKDMLEEKAIDRPTAQELFRSIKQSGGGVFCRKCCLSEGSTESDTSSDSDNSDDDRDEVTIRPSFVNTSPPKTTYLHEYEADNSFEKEWPRQSVVADPIESTRPPERAPLHRQVFKRLYSYFPGIRLPAKDENLPKGGIQKPYTPTPTAVVPPVTKQNSAVESSKVHDPYECSLPGSFPGYPSSEIPQYQVAESTDTPQDLESKENFADDQRPPPENESPTDIILEVPTPATEDIQMSIDNPVSSMSDVFQDTIPIEDCLFNPGPNGFITQIRGPSDVSFSTLQTLLAQPSRRLPRARSDENLQIQQKTNALLSITDDGYEDTPSESRSRRFSDGGGDEFTSHVSRENDVDELRKWKSELENLANPPDQTTQSQNLRVIPNKKKPATTEDFTLNYIHQTSQVYEAEALLDPNRPTSPVERSNIISKSATPRATNPLPQSRLFPERPKSNPLKAWFTQARSPEIQKTSGPPRLTGETLRIHNNEVPPLKKKSHPTFKIETASVFMQQVYNDTASSVATSVMSTRTRKSMKLYGLMLPLQDRSSHFLERYTKAGKADAVRMLLREGCNPGTIKEPRPDPIFYVVRGASSRHTKCLRSLIDHKVHVNVRAKLTRKTPLIEAVEQEAWSGYVTVIFLLLAAGANPNAKDGAGDVALLKLLGAGLKPLQEHRRKALALLLSTSYNTNINVTPLGTGNNPLHLAIRRVDPWALSMLLEKDNSLIEAKNSEGLTPLSHACSAWTSTITSGQLEILDVLLEKKANVNVNTTAGAKTPLHTAVSLGLVDAVERLLVNGADPLRKTKDGKTAQDMAEERKNQHDCNDCADCTEIQFLLVRHIPKSSKNDEG